MIDFNDLQEVDVPKPVKHHANKVGEYVIGFDPFEQAKEKESGINVFTIYSKPDGRITLRCRTKKNFDEFVEFIQAGDSYKQLYSVSRKFINNDGTYKTIEQIRTEFPRPQGYIAA